MIVTEREREREAETQAEGEAGSMYREPDVGLHPASPGSHPGPKAGAKLLSHTGIPIITIHTFYFHSDFHKFPITIPIKMRMLRLEDIQLFNKCPEWSVSEV